MTILTPREQVSFQTPFYLSAQIKIVITALWDAFCKNLRIVNERVKCEKHNFCSKGHFFFRWQLAFYFRLYGSGKVKQKMFYGFFHCVSSSTTGHLPLCTGRIYQQFLLNGHLIYFCALGLVFVFI